MSVRHKNGILTVYCLLRPDVFSKTRNNQTKIQLTVDSHAVLVNSYFIVSSAGEHCHCFDSVQMLVYFSDEQTDSCSML